MHEAAKSLALKVIAPERSGYGLSDPDPQRTIANWPHTVHALADHLGVDKFHLIGLSGGGPYAASCAIALKDQVQSLSLLSSMGPIETEGAFDGIVIQNKLLLTLGKNFPKATYPIFGAVGTLWRLSPGAARRWLRLILHKSDKQLLGCDAIAKVFEENLNEALGRSIEGARKDFELITQPWGIELSEVCCPTRVWHGDADNYVSPAMGRSLASQIPGATYKNIPGAGHFGAVNIISEVLEWIAYGSLQKS